MGNVDTSSKAVEGADLDTLVHTMLATQKRHSDFSYRIQSSPDPVLGSVIEEFRTDSDNSSVSLNDAKPGSPRGVGFSNSWMMFMPANQAESKFRFLGHQKIDGRDTVVLAYAQIPDRVRLPAEIGVHGDTCPFYTQGIVWIDPAIYQPIRLQTDLIQPIAGIHLEKMRSEVKLAEVKIPERNLSLWMPSDVEITWATDTGAGGELHRYTNYRLFTATSKIVTTPSK
jgi:hypothetical protein